MTTPRRATLGERRPRVHAVIREAAIEEFPSAGLPGASIRGSADRAGLSKPQLHCDIGTEEKLYEEPVVAEWDAIVFSPAEASDPVTAIADDIRRRIRHAAEHPPMSRPFARELASGALLPRRHRRRSRGTTKDTAAVVRRRIAEEITLPVDLHLFRVHIWAATEHDVDQGARIETEVIEMFSRRCGLGPPDRGERR